MVNAYGLNGEGNQAIKLFEEMRSAAIPPDNISMYALLNAASHAGLVEHALRYYHAMERGELGVTPDHKHATCVVDALGRKGRLAEAEKFALKVSSPDAQLWMSLLGACRWQGDISRAYRAHLKIMALNPPDTTKAASFVALSNTYSMANEPSLKNQTWMEMYDQGLNKTQGHSWIEINGTTHGLSVASTTHPLSDRIHSFLHELSIEMKDKGYIFDTSAVTHGGSQKAKEVHLCGHSEKMALALGLLSTPEGTHLRITKNLRMCPDCHNAIAFISSMRNRLISVRDANRWHHFEHGKCSCNNYW